MSSPATSTSKLYEAFNLLDVDEETKTVVSSYISHCQHLYLSHNRLLRIIPDLVTHVVMIYYYRTNSIYEWQVTDESELVNIRNAVPGYSFNHHFKLHKLDWFLKFYPNGTKQSKQGNVFLLLYLRSTPEISKMSATCRVWLSELDKGREHYKDFNERNKYTGWRSGLVKTSEIAGLRTLTFQVTIQIFEIYDKDNNNVTNKYIGLGIDHKQTISSLRKELQCEKAKVQRLTIEVDELNFRLSQAGAAAPAIASAAMTGGGDVGVDSGGGARGGRGARGAPPLAMMKMIQHRPSYDDALQAEDEQKTTQEPQDETLAVALQSRRGSRGSRGSHGSLASTSLHQEPELHPEQAEQESGSGGYQHHNGYQHQHQRQHHSSSMLARSGAEQCKQRFSRWLVDNVKLGQYLGAFRAVQCDDVRMIEFFDSECLERDIGVKSVIHRRLIMKKVSEFK